MYLFLVALQFLTRLPSPIRREITMDELGASTGWFPLVGATIGAILVVFDSAALRVLDRPVVDGLLVATLVALTGALHLDGVVDTASGLAAGPHAQARLAAMHESQPRGVGVIAGCTILLATYAAFRSLESAARPVALLLAPLCSRTAILLAYRFYPYARPGASFSRTLKEGATPRRAIAGLGAAVGVSWAVAGLGGLAMLAVAVACMHLLAVLSQRKLGGITGDVQGTIAEATQLAVLLVAPWAHAW